MYFQRIREYLQSRSISCRLYVIAIPVIVLAVSLYSYLNSMMERSMLDAEVENTTVEIAKRLAADIEQSAALAGAENLQLWLAELVESNFYVTRAEVFQLSGTQLLRKATTSRPSAAAAMVEERIAMQQLQTRSVLEYREGDRLLRVIAPITGPGGPVGCVSITSSLRQSELVAEKHGRLALFLIPAVVLVLILLIHFLFTRVLTGRIERLDAAMSSAQSGNLKMRAPVERRDEIGRIASRFNEAMEEIDRSMAERDRLLEEQKHFNEILQEKVAEATEELSQANENLSQLNRDLVETQKDLSHFERLAVAGHIAATLAHEIGSPLSAVSTHLQLLAEDLCSSAESKRRIESIQAQLTRITGFVEELLSRTRPLTTEKAPVRMNEVLKHLLAFLDLHLHRHGIAVEIRFQPNLPDIQGNQQQIEQVFLNLLNNATDAMPDGGTISIQTLVEQASPGGEFVAVSVRDTGTGIPEAYQAHIFDPFFTTKSSGQGTGLGLSIASRIVRQHEGTIQVQSEPHRGTTFWIRFPAVPGSPSEPNTRTA